MKSVKGVACGYIFLSASAGGLMGSLTNVNLNAFSAALGGYNYTKRKQKTDTICGACMGILTGPVVVPFILVHLATKN